MIQAVCDTGCKQQFTVQDTQSSNLDGGVEKTFFTCPHCQHEYVAFYTDAEIRKLQEKIRKVQRKFASWNYNHKALAKQEAKLKTEIQTKMRALRQRIERRE